MRMAERVGVAWMVQALAYWAGLLPDRFDAWSVIYLAGFLLFIAGPPRSSGVHGG